MAVDRVLTIDVGTGSIHAGLYSLTQNASTAAAACPYGVEHPAPSRAEFDPQQMLNAVGECVQACIRKDNCAPSSILGITITSMRQAFVLLDRDANPLGPGVLNYDRRGVSTISRIGARIPLEELYGLTGHWPAPELTLPKLLWFRDECPDLWSRTAHMLFAHDWIVFQLCGEIATEPSLICAGQMADVSKRTWAFGLLESLGLSRALFPTAVEAGTRLGALSADTARAWGLSQGTPVHIGGGDTQFCSLGVGAMGAGCVAIVGGSTTPIQMTTDAPLRDPLRFPWISTHLAPNLWAAETNAGHTGMIYKWFRDTFCRAEVEAARAMGLDLYTRVNELATSSPIGSNGLLTVAASPRWAQDTWGNKAPYAIHNFTVAHTLGDVARSILEGVCFGIRGNLEQLERASGMSFAARIFTGGCTRSTLWCQMLADVVGDSIRVPQVEEPALAAGAYLVARGQAIMWELSQPAATIYQPNPERHSAYQAFYQRYLDTFEKMQSSFGQ
jgi:autoinducer-2 kinase